MKKIKDFKIGEKVWVYEAISTLKPIITTIVGRYKETEWWQCDIKRNERNEYFMSSNIFKYPDEEEFLRDILLENSQDLLNYARELND